MNKKTIRDIDLKNKKVLVRCDFNVPMDENKNITDNARIVAALPTIKYLLENNCAIILCSHLGRPKGEFKPEFSLKPVAKELSKLLNKEVIMANDVIGEDAKNKAKNLKNGEIMLLENVRFHREETDNDPEFSKQLASLAEIYVNDAFGAAHRAHSSTAGIAQYLPAVAGFLIEKELKFLGNALNNPERPFVAILGGAKVSDKIGVIDNLLEKVDTLIIGGGMAYTFFKAQGYEVGKSLCELDKLDLAKELMEKAKNKSVKLMLPADTKIGKEFDIKPIGLGARDTLRLEAALHLYGNDLDENTTPVEAGLSWSIPKNKLDDYNGRTVIENQLTNGAPKKLIGIVMLDRGIARHEYDVYYNNEKVGTVTSGGISPVRNENIALAYVKSLPEITIDSIVQVDIRGKMHNAKYRALILEILQQPFNDRSHIFSRCGTAPLIINH